VAGCHCDEGTVSAGRQAERTVPGVDAHLDRRWKGIFDSLEIVTTPRTSGARQVERKLGQPKPGEITVDAHLGVAPGVKPSARRSARYDGGGFFRREWQRAFA